MAISWRTVFLAVTALLLLASVALYLAFGPSELPALVSALVPCITLVAIPVVIYGVLKFLQQLKKRDSSTKGQVDDERSIGIALHAWLLIVFAVAASLYVRLPACLHIGGSAGEAELIGLFFLVFLPLLVLGIWFLVSIPSPYKWLPWMGLLLLPTYMVLPYPNLSYLIFMGMHYLSQLPGLKTLDKNENAFYTGALIAIVLACVTIWQYIRLYRSGTTKANG